LRESKDVLFVGPRRSRSFDSAASGRSAQDDILSLPCAAFALGDRARPPHVSGLTPHFFRETIVRVGILTISDRCAAGTAEDRSGPILAAWAERHGYVVAARQIVPDETAQIAATLVGWCVDSVADLVITTGGTGVAPRDRTPEATRAVIEREVPGIAEAIRADALATVPLAALGRGVAGVRGRTLIVNLPGAPRAVEQGLRVLDPLVEHAVRLLAGETEH
jgi:molybdenum cofactor synthesis domain-containing protein